MVNHEQLTPEERTFGMLCHLSALAQFILPSFGNIFGPLIFWLIKKDQSAWVDRQGKEALNFQISIVIYVFAAFFLMFLLAITVIGIPLAALIAIGLAVFWLVMVITASIKVNDGEDFRYPLNIRFIK